jgi:hypothetical protein
MRDALRVSLQTLGMREQQIQGSHKISVSLVHKSAAART